MEYVAVSLLELAAERSVRVPSQELFALQADNSVSIYANRQEVNTYTHRVKHQPLKSL